MSWRGSFLLVLVVLVLSNVFWAYTMLGEAVRVTHMGDQLNLERQSVNTLKEIALQLAEGWDREKFTSLVSNLPFDEDRVYEKGQAIVVNGVSFVFDDRKLRDIKTN